MLVVDVVNLLQRMDLRVMDLALIQHIHGHVVVVHMVVKFLGHCLMDQVAQQDQVVFVLQMVTMI